jgi:hypothetical protein
MKKGANFAVGALFVFSSVRPDQLPYLSTHVE